MNGDILIFRDIGTDKPKLHYPKNPNWIENVNMDKILISDKFSLVKRVVKNLLITKMMIITLTHRARCFKK